MCLLECESLLDGVLMYGGNKDEKPNFLYTTIKPIGVIGSEIEIDRTKYHC